MFHISPLIIDFTNPVGVVEDLLRIQNELTDLKDDYSVVADERNRFLDKYNELRRYISSIN